LREGGDERMRNKFGYGKGNLYINKTTKEKVDASDCDGNMQITTECPVRKFIISRDEFEKQYVKW
jgi:hypothetical protein